MDEAARDRLFAAGEALMGERGFFRVPLAEIAGSAGLDADDVRAQFADSEALLIEIVKLRAHELRSLLHTAVTGLGSRTMMEGIGFQTYFRWIAEHPHILRLIRQSELVDREVFRSWYRDLASDYARGLSRSMDEGEITTFDPEALAWCLMGMGDFVGMRYVLWDERSELPAAALQTFQRVLTRTLAAGSR